MRPMKRASRVLCSFLTLCASSALAVLLLSGSASAQPTPSMDPQTTNVPYLAWVGEQIRLVKCFSPDSVDSLGNAEFQIDSWSGDPNSKPQIEQSTVQLVTVDGVDCAVGDAIAFDPGMARIELDVTDGINVTVLKHQFLAGWMTLNKPTLTELGSGDFASTAQSAAAAFLGDPAGDGHFIAGDKPGILSAKVTGTMPMNGTWAALVGAPSVTLPGDWVMLANALATDSNPNDANPAMRWDIHDGTTDVEGHITPTPPCAPEPALSPTPPAAPAGTDAVDNCAGGDGFSRVFGDLSLDPSIGPFDPVRADATLLSDGLLNAADAPMPAARVDVSIAQNSGAPTDITGVGSLDSQPKTQSYSRDFTGSDTPHNLYAPFYSAFIPPTAPLLASGIDGPASGNNFPGFLVNGEYTFWDIADVFASNGGGATSCLQRSPDPQSSSPLTRPQDFFQMPSGSSNVAIYTDEHGEGQIRFTPGTGFFFNSLIARGSALLNADGGCDLQSLFKVEGGLGSADITAVARYPYKPVNYPALASDPVHKDVTSLWDKTLSVFPKGPGAENANARIVVAHAQNIDGSPFVDEVVCFSSDAEGMAPFDGVIRDASGNVILDLTGSTGAPDPKLGLGRVCARTDGNGNAAVEVLESKAVHVNVIADFTEEGILRSVDADFTIAPTSVNNLPSGGTVPTSSNGTKAPSPALISKIAPALLPQGSSLVKHISPRLTLARLYRPLRGQHYVALEVTSKSGTARIRLTMTVKVRVIRHGKAHTITRTITKTITVRTGRVVNVTVSSSVIAVKATLLR
jgi:hypothetical protein